MTEAEFLQAFEDAVAESDVLGNSRDEACVSYPTWTHSHDSWQKYCPINTVVHHRTGAKVLRNGGAAYHGTRTLGLTQEQCEKIMCSADCLNYLSAKYKERRGLNVSACFFEQLVAAKERGLARRAATKPEGGEHGE